MPTRPNRTLLLKVLQDNGGRLGNLNARRLLGERFGAEVRPDDYEHIKDQLISAGLIKKGMGRGGSIELIPAPSSDSPETIRDSVPQEGLASAEEQLETLFNSLSHVPGLRAKRNRSTITILCGEDNDKLYSGWDEQRVAFFIRYRVEADREDHSPLAESLFQKAGAKLPFASVQRLTGATTLYLNENVAQVNRVVRILMGLLESETFGNAPRQVDAPSAPRPEDYYLETASLIKHCTDNNLHWPLKRWRQSLGFDEVDELVLIGRSPLGRESARPYREHAVPACVIRDESLKLAMAGAPVKVIADFIQHHLFVVLISPSEADLLNRKEDDGGVSLKTSMPEGWIVGDDPLERFHVAGIPVLLDRPYPLPEWKPWKPRLSEKLREILNRPILKV